MLIQSTTDDLTNLMNRRAFNSIAEEILANKIQRGSQISLLHLDIDNFKKNNDTYGHCFGDDALLEVGRCLKENWHPTETIAKHVHAGPRKTLVLEFPVTTSIRMATCFANYDTIYQELLNQAEQAMY